MTGDTEGHEEWFVHASQTGRNEIATWRSATLASSTPSRGFPTVVGTSGAPKQSCKGLSDCRIAIGELVSGGGSRRIRARTSSRKIRPRPPKFVT